MPEPRIDLAAALPLALLLAAGCAFAPAPSTPRPALTPADLGLAVAAVASPTVRGLREEPPGRFAGTLEGGGETVSFELHTTPGHPGRPVVLLVPILSHGEELLDMVGRRLQAHGYDVAHCGRAGSALQQGQRSADLDQLFRRTLLHQRLLLRWLRERQEPAAPQFVLGLSLGGMVTTVLAAQEPSLDGVAICLAGGDLADLVARSSEPRVRRWRQWRRDVDGLGEDGLRWELAQFLTHEPLRYAPAVATGRVLLVGAAFDTVVPRHHQDLLWEALGRPARFLVPLGHYSAALAMDAIVDRIAVHFGQCLASRPGAPR